MTPPKCPPEPALFCLGFSCAIAGVAVRQLAQLHDEGFARVWMSQMPFEPDLLTALAVVLEPAPDADGAARVDAEPDQRRTPIFKISARSAPKAP